MLHFGCELIAGVVVTHPVGQSRLGFTEAPIAVGAGLDFRQRFSQLKVENQDRDIGQAVALLVHNFTGKCGKLHSKKFLFRDRDELLRSNLCPIVSRHGLKGQIALIGSEGLFPDNFKIFRNGLLFSVTQLNRSGRDKPQRQRGRKQRGHRSFE